jgi:hypothetical protein
MITFSRLAFGASIPLVFALASRSVSANDDGPPPSTEPSVDESIGPSPQVDPGPPLIEAQPETTDSKPQGPILPPPVARPMVQEQAFQPASIDLWPIEYVLRPQTLPEGLIELGARSSVFRPQSGPLTTAAGTPYTFNSNLALGFWVRVGLPKRFDFEFSAPRVLCLESSAPSGCGEINRYNGTGASVSHGLLRFRTLQLKLSGNISIVRSAKPLTWAWELGARTKILFGQVVALEMALDLNRRIDPGPSQTDTSVRGSFVLDLNVQATHHLNLFIDLNPYTPVDRLGDPALELFGGASWTFRNQSEIVASTGIYNVRSHRSWDTGVPGTFAVLSMVFWSWP